MPPARFKRTLRPMTRSRLHEVSSSEETPPANRNPKEEIESPMEDEEVDNTFPLGVAPWRFRSIAGRCKYLLEQSILTDITLVVGPEATPFQAHKLILASGSPVFDRMFFGALAERGDEVIIPDIMPEGFKVLLQYIYADIVDLENVTQAFQALAAAEKYSVPRLKRKCGAFLETFHMNMNTVWELMEGALLWDIPSLRTRCLEQISKHTTDYLQAPSFVETSTKIVESVLSLNTVQCSEVSLFKHLVQWGNFQVAARRGEVTLRDILWPLLPNVRISTMTPCDFCRVVEEAKNLFNKEEELAVLKYLVDPVKATPPTWLCEKAWGRNGSTDGPSLREKTLKLHQKTKHLVPKRLASSTITRPHPVIRGLFVQQISKGQETKNILRRIDSRILGGEMFALQPDIIISQ